MTEATPRLSEPLEQAWRVAMRWPTLICQFAGVLAVLLVIGAGSEAASWFDSAACKAAIHTATALLVWLLSIEAVALVMARAWAELTGNREFRTGHFIAGSILPVAVVGLLCALAIVIISILPHCVMLLLTRTSALGKIIFALALVPLVIVALAELLLALAVLFIFPPMLVDSRLGAGTAVQAFIDAAIGCRYRDIGVRLRGFVTAVLIAIPILVAAALCGGYFTVLAGMTSPDLLPAGWLYVRLMSLSGMVIVSGLLAPPLSYLCSACLMVHKATQG